MLKRSSVVLAALAAVALAVSTLFVVGPSNPALAASFTMTVVSPVPGRIGVDAIYQGGGGGGQYDVKTCSVTDEPTLGWNSAGQLVGAGTVPDSQAGLGALTQIRFEMYPGECGMYDGWGDVGGVHIEVAPGVRNLGQIVMPVADRNGGIRLVGDILSSTPVTDGRVRVDTFQIASGYPSPPAPLQQNGAVEYGAFASTASKGARWSGGVGWQGLYLLFVNDVATGRGITALVDIAPGAIPTIDLDAICFGFDTCNYGAGGPTTTTGAFHPTAPTRILDTRNLVGITNGPVTTGDGRNPSPDPLTRRDETANHDLQVTGRFGVPSSGVSAVLLNVTAVDAPGPGFLSLVPKPARVGDVFNDQGTYGAFASTSNLNVANSDATPNLVLARVGAGGKIRIANFFGPTHVIADIAGWFGTGGAYTDGAGFAGVVPSRVMDSRLGIGGPASPLGAGESRSVQVAGVAGIPATAESVAVNITVVGSSGAGYVTGYPDGEALPNASNVNITPGGVRANTAVIKVGAGGRIRLLLAETNADVIVDVLGSFGRYGGKVTAVTPERVADTRAGVGTEARPLGQFETRDITIAGRGSVPANATAVIANVTATDTTAWGYLSAWPTGAAQPTASNLNFLPGQTVPNLAMLKLGAGGSLSVFNGPGSANVVIDVMGYVT